jgi:hypothetical protein
VSEWAELDWAKLRRIHSPTKLGVAHDYVESVSYKPSLGLLGRSHRIECYRCLKCSLFLTEEDWNRQYEWPPKENLLCNRLDHKDE